MERQFESLLLHARELPSREERTAWLDKACGGDLKLRARIEARLLVESEAEAYFGEMGTRKDHELRADIAGEKPGDIIGEYKLRQQIGEGGFGTVWMADQFTPVRRRVALKIIKLGMDTKEVVARFEQERQALAMMDHPNIARVFDAGTTQ